MAKNDRVRNLHHSGLQVYGEQNTSRFGLFNLIGQKQIKRTARHECRIHNSARTIGDALLQNSDAAILRHQFNSCCTRLLCGQRDRFFVRKEIIARHGRHNGLAVWHPFTHRMRVGHCVIFDGNSRTTIRIAFAQNRVHRRAFNRIKTVANGFFRYGFWILWIVRNGVALVLQFLYSRHKLRRRSRNIWKLDNIGIWVFDQFAQFSKIVSLTLIRAQIVWKRRNDTACKRNILNPN